MDFTAIDFETANYKRHSICQIGLVRVENGHIVKEIDILVRPPDNYYLTRFTNEIHGIGSNDTAHSPNFEAVWEILRPFIEDQNVVAHNAVFDVGCLKHTLAFYDLAIPKFVSHCTYRIYKMGLAAACKENGIELHHHHNALADAKACAQLFLKTF